MLLDIAQSAVFESIGSGLRNLVYNKTGIIQNLGKTTAPSLQIALIMGAASGGIHYTTDQLKEKIKNDYLSPNNPIASVLDPLQLALGIAFRYRLARVCNRFFGHSIENRYLHLLTGADLLKYGSGLGSFALLSWGVVTAIVAKFFSIFITTPTLKNAFYFGAISGAITISNVQCTSLTYKGIKKIFKLEDPRKQLIIHTALLSLSIFGSLYAAWKGCNHYFQLNIPKSYLIFQGLISIPGLFVFPIFLHIWLDFMCADFDQICDLLRDNNHIVLAQEIQQIYHYGDEVERTQASATFIWGLFEQYDHIGVVNLFEAIWNSWKEGRSPEIILVEAISSLATNQQAITPILHQVNQQTLASVNKEGADFIIDEVLKDASQKFMEKVRACTPEYILFIQNKGVSAYIAGNHQFTEPPTFFQPETRTQIMRLREELLQNSTLRATYKTIDQKLCAAIKDGHQEDPSALQGLNSQKQAALNRLKGIAYREQQGKFIRDCYRIALTMLS